jgi:hypothetical protein
MEKKRASDAPMPRALISNVVHSGVEVATGIRKSVVGTAVINLCYGNGA